MVTKLIKASFIRAIWTFLEVLVTYLGGASIFYEVNWKFAFGASAFAALLAFLKCLITGLPEVEKEILGDDLALDDEEFMEDEDYDDEH